MAYVIIKMSLSLNEKGAKMETNLKRQAVPFTQVPNELLYHPDISFKAKGIWAYMSAKPEGWQFSADRIAKETKEDRKAILSGLKELSEWGYITAKKLASGRVEYTLHWEVATKPKANVAPKPVSEPEAPEPEVEKPRVTRPSSRPKRENYDTDREWEEALYAWSSMPAKSLDNP